MPSGYIPKEQLDAYRRWQVDSFDAPPVPASPPPAPEEPVDMPGEMVPDIGLPTAEDIERIHNEAHAAGYQTGFDEGRQAGYQAGLEAVQADARRIAGLSDNIESAIAGIDQAIADQVLALGLEVARQVLRSAIPARPEALLGVIREAIAALPLHHGHVSLHINPADAELVREHLGDNFLHSGWRIIDDRDVEPGGCLLRAGNSEIDASVATRWKRVLEAIGASRDEWLDKP